MNNEINDKNYIPLTPFKGWVLENFPFIEANFDAITNYELLCLIVKYLNEVISNQNQVQELGTELVTAYNQLLDYVNKYFDNLDIQEEIDNKLDDMAESGELAEIVELFVTKTEMVVIGDSFSSRSYLANQYKLWCEIVADTLELNLHNYADPGSGFINPGDERHKTFLQQIEEAYADTSFNNDKVKYLFVMGGLNDLRYASTNNISSFNQAYNQIWITARARFPKAKIIYLGCPSFANLEQKQMNDNQVITQLYVDNYIKHCEQFLNKQIISLDMTLFYTGMSAYFVNGVGTHPNYIAHRDLSTAVLNGLTSSSNAFTHIVTAIPVIDSQSSSAWTSGTTVVGENIYQLRITDKEVKLYLSTALTRSSNTQTSCMIDLPFNMIIPYSTLDNNNYVPQNNIGNYFWYVSDHTTTGCQGTGILPVINNLGYKYMNIYARWIDSTALTIDLNYKIDFNL